MWTLMFIFLVLFFVTLSIIRKSYLPDDIKRGFFHTVALWIVL